MLTANGFRVKPPVNMSATGSAGRDLLQAAVTQVLSPGEVRVAQSRNTLALRTGDYQLDCVRAD